ncbi:MAG: VCBS repeat-containing protein [Verrucomicrobiota bacterium]
MNLIRLYLPLLLAAALLPATASAQPAIDLLKGEGQMEAGKPGVIPWAGIGDNELLAGRERDALVVLTSGAVKGVPYPGGVDVADLTGDDLPDLVLGDSNGFWWLYPNTGTAKDPKWVQGELLPLWLVPIPIGKDEKEEVRNIWNPTANYQPACSRFYLMDFNQDGLKDMVLGDYLGNIMFLQNTGAGSRPEFATPNDLKTIMKPTGPGGRLWGNYLAPVYEDFTGDRKPDLLVGEGTYSANSVWLFPNEGTAQAPRFNWETRQRLIPGMGREHLTPRPVDWNNDGKTDLLVGEREGKLNVYLNNQRPGQNEASFNQDPIIPKFGGSEVFSTLAAPTVHDVNGDGLFDLIGADTNNNILLAVNKGLPGEPQFDKPVKLKGKNPYPAIKAPSQWKTANPLMASYYTLRLVSNDQEDPLTYDPDFSPTPNESDKGKFALKYETVPYMSRYITGKPTVPRKLINRIRGEGKVTFKPKTKYKVTFWARGDGLTNHTFWLRGSYQYKPEGTNERKTFHKWMDKSFSVGAGWREVSLTYEFKAPSDAPKETEDKPMSFGVDIVFKGEGNLYIDNLTIKES